MIYLESNVLIRYFISEAEPHLVRLHRQAASLFESVERGEQEITISEVVLHEVASVLSSRRLYQVPRADVADYLAAFIGLPGLRLARGDQSLFLRAIELFGQHSSISMADALIVARAERQHIPLATFDRALDRLPYAESWQFQE